jgi:hypothetical protein
VWVVHLSIPCSAEREELRACLLVVLCPKTANTQQGVKKSKGNLLKNNACQQISNYSSLDHEKRWAIMVIQIGT